MFPSATLSHRSNGRRAARSGTRGALLALAMGAVAFAVACGTEGPASSGAAVDSVAISPDTLRLLVGGSGRLGVTVRDVEGTSIRGRSVFWSSADNTIATVDQDGLVTAVRAGTVRVSANVEGHSAIAAVIVRPAGPATITVDPPTASVVVGATTPLVATVRDASGNILTDRAPVWSSSNGAVATVSQQGVVTGVSPGTATIIAARDGVTGTATVTVVRAPVARVVVSPSNPTVKIGSSVQLTATLYDAQGRQLTGRTVTWTSSNPAIASVDGNGRVVGKLVGAVTITAASEGQTGTAAVTVKLN